MKKIPLTLVIFLSACQLTFAQWTTGPGNINNTNSGNVGIGTSTPQAILSTVVSSAGANSTGLLLQNSGGTVANTAVSLDFVVSPSLTTSTAVGRIFAIRTNRVYSGDADMAFNTFSNNVSVERVRIMDNGNFGIGTTSPNALLTVGSPTTRGTMNIAGTATQTPIINLVDNQTSGHTFSLYSGLSGAGHFDILDQADHTYRFTIDSTGNIGIGTTNPGSYKLAVKGNVHAQQVNVDLTGWSDYVFKSNYHLPPLADVKTYIDKNHHLPEIPSEAEVIKDGINLGDMNKLLVKKVEELTLYMLEKDKQLKEQAHQLGDAQQKLLNQEQRLKLLETKLDQLLNKTN